MEKYNILVIDDDHQSLQILNAYLTEINPAYNIVKANRSEKALKFAVSRIPDLIITDWEMPVLNGLELIKKLKADDRTKEIPVIMLTGFMIASENIKEAYDAGAVDFISKPVRKVELSARIKSALFFSEKLKKINLQNQTKHKFISIVANNLADPFKDILKITQKLTNECDNISTEKIKDTLNNLNENIKLNYNLLNHFVLWSSLQNKEILFKPEKISIKKILAETNDFFKTTSLNKNISFNINLEKDTTVFADKNMLIYILEILINNAFKYTKANGSVNVNTSEHEKFTEFIVSDTGTGISEKALKDLFIIDRIRSTPGIQNEKGTGLGLILCKEFIEMNKGEVWVGSKVKKGSQFHFTIPHK